MSLHSKVVDLLYELVKDETEKDSPDHVWKEEKVQELQKQGIKYEPDIHALSHRGKIDVFQVWLGENWHNAVTDLLHALRIENGEWINIVVVNMHRKYGTDRAWRKEDVEEISRFLMPLLSESGKNRLENRLRIIEIDQDELDDSNMEHLKVKLKTELSLS